jgi:hypothetical protein
MGSKEKKKKSTPTATPSWLPQRLRLCSFDTTVAIRHQNSVQAAMQEVSLPFSKKLKLILLLSFSTSAH